MTFVHIASSSHYRDLRLLSGDGVWELGLSLFASGMRLRMGRTGRPPSVLDFCLGQDAELFLPIFSAVLQRLETISESASAAQIDALFPWAGTRPDLNVHLAELLDVTIPA